MANRQNTSMRDDRGAAALEFALVVPLLLVLVFGMIEFGFFFSDQLTVVQAAREGARIASVRLLTTTDINNVKNKIVLSPESGPPGVSYTYGATLGDQVTCTVTYTYTPRYLMALLPVVKAKTLTSSATMRREY